MRILGSFQEGEDAQITIMRDNVGRRSTQDSVEAPG